jgi:TetR/AcrR family transcriptional regulator
MAAWKNAVLSRSAQHAMKREALMREAAASFNRRGFHATSLEELAANLGVTKAALYHYFPNKHKVLLACFERAMDAAFRGLERAKSEGRNAREKIHLALKYYLQEMIDELSCCVVLTEEHAVQPEDLASHIKERDRYERIMRTLVREGIADGSIVPCNPKLAVFMVMGALNWGRKWYRPQGDWSGAQIAQALSEMLERALSSTPARALIADPAAARPREPEPAVVDARARRRPA